MGITSLYHLIALYKDELKKLEKDVMEKVTVWLTIKYDLKRTPRI